MSNKKTIITIFTVLFIIFALLFFNFAYENLFIPEGYISINKCPQAAKYAINKKKIPKRQLISCTSEKATYEFSRSMDLVEIKYGEPADCMSGCIYKGYKGYVDLETGEIINKSNY